MTWWYKTWRREEVRKKSLRWIVREGGHGCRWWARGSVRATRTIRLPFRITAASRWEASKGCITGGNFILPFVRAPLYTLLPLFPHAVYTAFLDTILDTTLTGTNFVATLTCGGTIGARHFYLLALWTRPICCSGRWGLLKLRIRLSRGRGIRIQHARCGSNWDHKWWSWCGPVRAIPVVGVRRLSKVYRIAGICGTEALRIGCHSRRIWMFLGNWARTFSLVVYHYQATKLKTGLLLNSGGFA